MRGRAVPEKISVRGYTPVSHQPKAACWQPKNYFGLWSLQKTRVAQKSRSNQVDLSPRLNEDMGHLFDPIRKTDWYFQRKTGRLSPDVGYKAILRQLCGQRANNMCARGNSGCRCGYRIHMMYLSLRGGSGGGLWGRGASPGYRARRMSSTRKNAAGVGPCGTDPEQVGCYPLEKKDDQ